MDRLNLDEEICQILQVTVGNFAQKEIGQLSPPAAVAARTVATAMGRSGDEPYIAYLSAPSRMTPVLDQAG